MKLLPKALLTTMFSLAAAGCGDAPAEDPINTLVDEGTADVQQHASVSDGTHLFKRETFGGNGRTCLTCHTEGTGTLSPAQAQALYNANPNDPLFRAIDSDNGTGSSYSKLLTHATVTVEIDLPPNVVLAANPTQRKVTLRRSIPSTIDAPSLDSMLMFDGRAASLQAQAAGAIAGHAQATRTPTADELNSIVMFEKTLFSSEEMKKYARNEGPAPAIPAGNTESEKRGRAWFAETALCGSCHAGALLNKATAGNPLGLPAGSQFGTALVAERNKLNNPMREYIVTNSNGLPERVTTPDPGLMLVTGNYADRNLFKMLSLRNLKNTAPYFHDGSAKTIEDIMDQYNFLLDTLGIPHTDQDILDMTAYLKLL
jgi:cytochrome c peroxidase